MAQPVAVEPRRSARGGRRWRLLRFALVAYLAALAVVLLAPTSDAPGQVAQGLSELGIRLGFSPETATRTRAEVLLNVGVLAPVPFLGSLLWPGIRWRHWFAGALVTSVGVELAQALLPERTPSVRDVVTNTGGAWMAAVLATAARRLSGWQRAGRS